MCLSLGSQRPSLSNHLACLLLFVALTLVGGSQVANAQNPFRSSVDGYPSWSAFSGVRWKENRPMVEYEGQWYELIEFHGIKMESIRKACEEKGWELERRVTEDLVQIVRLMGGEIEKHTHFVLKNAKGEMEEFRNVEMTEARLEKVMQAAAEEKRETLLRAGRSLTPEKIAADMAAFREGLESRFAYLLTNDVDYQTELFAIEQRLLALDAPASSDLARELNLLLMKFIDGHASVAGWRDFEEGCLPFLIEMSGSRYVAIESSRRSFLNASHPHIRSIDGIPVDRWLEPTRKYVASGSPQMKRARGLRLLRYIAQFRKETGRPASQTIDVELESPDGSSSTIVTVKLAEERLTYGLWPLYREPEILDGNIGYFRITQMDEEAVALIKASMEKFRKTDGLIIDVRGNGGGIRTPLIELTGYLQRPEDQPRFGNVARYRLSSDFSKNHLSEARYVYRENSRQFDQRDREAIAEFRRTFKPEWEPPADLFSEWHYMVFSKSEDDPRYYYDRPVVILMDERCFSATDIFLGALKGWPNVTLMGQSSSGGSARSQSFDLPNSNISVRCASMASFQPNGELYDGNGIQPDVLVTRTPEYYLTDGRDNVLDKARAFIGKK